MNTLRVPGSIDPAGDELNAVRAGGLFQVSPKSVLRVDAVRTAQGSIESVEVNDDDVLLLELEGGIKLWTSFQQYCEDFPRQVSRDLKATTLEIPTELAFGTPSRGAGTWALKGLQVLGVDLPKMTATELASKLENRLVPAPGLYQLTDAERFQIQATNGNEAALLKGEPLLLFIHGTASCTSGCFGSLWAPEANAWWRELFSLYPNRILTSEHHTLTQSPIENARDLVKSLPEGARLHLVTHSRGGLVGELLCRGSREDGREPFDSKEMDLFAREENERLRDIKALKELSRLLKSKRLKVERFVRVACPARGTTLASERLDRWLSVTRNLVGMIPCLKASPVYEFLTDLVLAFVKERTNPRALPGLESMMPDSPLIRLLNKPGALLDADLTIIAGDIEESSFLGKLKLLIPDFFYGGDHDLVVDTRSMYGGTQRKSGSRFFFDQGPDVSHFCYFLNEKTLRMLLAGLKRSENSDEGFELVSEPREIIHKPSGRGEGTQPVLFFLPGIMGTHLTVNGNRIWLDILNLAGGGLEKLRIDAENVKPQACLARYYNGLLEYLGTSHEVVTFPYDWRKSILEEGRRLGRDVSDRLDDAERRGQPVRFLAHSMGGLVARSMIAQCPKVWGRVIKHPSARLILLGTPCGGSHVIPRLLLGQEPLIRQLSLLDANHSLAELVEILSRFPGVLEMLPGGGDSDYFSNKFWAPIARAIGGQKATWPVPEKASLEAARAARKICDTSPIQPERMFYVAGSARSTPVAMEFDMNAAAGQRVRFLASNRGDGRVLWSTGIPKGLKAWYADVSHGDLAAFPSIFPVFQELLETGDTRRLAGTPPVAERDIEERAVIPLEPIEVFPDQGDLEAAALGSRRRLKPVRKILPIKVSVVHGNLAYLHHPVAVGHYSGDTIISAEAYLDRVLDGRIRRRHRLGLYPGPLLTSEILLSEEGTLDSRGAIIVGLGKVGELTPKGLSRTITHAALNYVVAISERFRRETGSNVPASKAVAISTLLIGTGAGGLSVDDCVTSILRGVYRANEALRESEQSSEVRIEEVEFVELYEDMAIQAARALERVQDIPQLQSQFECQTTVRRIDGGRRRATFEEPPGWWHRLQISSQSDGSLRFNALTRRARTEVSLLPTQRALLEGFIEQAIRSPSANHDVARTLFEMLLPNPLKEQAPDRQNLVLVLDQDSASYPWELLEDRWSGNKEPLAIESGMVRQLETQEFRARVVSTASNASLVIGNPVTNFVPLPGAAEEARRVATLLGVKPLVDEDADAILKALHADAYRILHLAGHGVHDYPLRPDKETSETGQQSQSQDGSRISGMVIGDGVFLTPADVEQMRQVPELVFVNCCHLGRTVAENRTLQDSRRDDRHKLAANIAAQFIRMGVRAVVAAGWAVDDDAAKTFATEFYRAMLSGIPFGQAVRIARSETYYRHRSVNTWGAYQCYGDPDFTLNTQIGTKRQKKEELRFHAPYEAFVEIENLAAEVESATPENRGLLLKRLAEICQQVKQKAAVWRDLSSVYAALGHAYGELDQFEDAINFYRMALGLKQADCPVQSIEQMANLQCRQAVELWKQHPTKSHSSRKTNPSSSIDEAIQLIESLLPFGKTVERLNLLASAWKRKAWVTGGLERQAALTNMQKYYGEAQSQGSAKQTDCYSLLNSVVSTFLLQQVRAGKKRKQPAVLQEAIAGAKAVAALALNERLDFWSTIAAAECELVSHLTEVKLEGHVEAIVQGLAKANLRGGTPRRYRSVLEQLEFLATILSDSSDPGIQRQVIALRKIHDQLRSRIAE